MTAPATPAPDGVAPAGSGPGTRMSAAPPQPEGDRAATRQHLSAEPDSAAQDGGAVVISLPTEIDVTNSLDVGVQLKQVVHAGVAEIAQIEHDHQRTPREMIT